MLDDLGSYSLSDFLQFSQETYVRLFELYNQSWWPLHALVVLGGAAALYYMLAGSARNRRYVAVGMGLAWAWLGWSFHLQQFASISLAAPYFAGLFFVEAGLLLVLAATGNWKETPDGAKRTAGTILFAYALVLHPAFVVLAGRTWLQTSVFAMAPDPTAIATVGFLLALSGRLRWLVLVPAVIWCVVASLTAHAMGTVEWIPPAAAAAAPVAVLLGTRSPSLHAGVGRR